jgi:hypothetical protein
VADRIAVRRSTCSGKGLVEALTGGQPAVQREHHLHRRDVVDVGDRRDDAGGALGQQCGREADHVLPADGRDDAGPAGGQHDPMGRLLEPVDVVNRERAVGQLEAGEHRALGAEGAVRGDVRESGTVQG